MKMSRLRLTAALALLLTGVLPLAWGSLRPPAVNASATAATVVRIGSGEPPLYPVAPGGQVTVPVEVVDAANLGAATLLLAYDPNLVQVVGCTAAQPGGVDLAVCNPTYAAGVVRFSLLAAAGLYGSQQLFTVTLQASAPAGTTAPLTLAAPQFVDNQGVDLPVTVTSGALAISGAAQPVDAVVRLDPAQAEIAPGQHVVVSANLVVTDARALAAATVLLHYDPQVVRPVQCVPAATSTLSGSCNPNFNLSEGILKFNVLAAGGVSGALHLFDIVFEVVGAAAPGATSLLTPVVETIVDPDGDALSWRAENGALTIGSTPANAAQVMVGAPGADGRLVITQGVVLTAPVWVMDVTNLGAATIAVRYDAGLLRPLGCTVHGASAGLDGGNCVVKAGQVLANIIAGQGVTGSIPIFDVFFTPVPGAGAGVASPLLLDVLNFADANADPLPWRTRNGLLELVPGDPSTLPLIGIGPGAGSAPVTVAQDGQVTVTVVISGATLLGAATLIIRYDPAVVTPVRCTPNGPFDGATCIIGAGEIRISLLSGAGFTGSAPVVELVFRSADNAEVGDQATLTLTAATFDDANGAPLLFQVATVTLQVTAATGAPVAVILRTNKPLYDNLPGQRFQVGVDAIVDAAALPQGLDIASVRLRYDPTVVRPVACTLNGNAFQGGGCNLTYAPDQIRFTLLAGAGATGEVRLVEIVFEAIGPLGATANLTLHVEQLLAAAAPALTYRTERSRVQITADGDGVPDAVEAGAPNNGDGNNDGIPDVLQLHVTSLQNPIDDSYVTLVAPPGACLKDVYFAANPAPADMPSGWTLALGIFSFTVECLTPGSAATVTLILHEVAEPFDRVFIYSRAQAQATQAEWLPFPLLGATGAIIAPGRIELHLVDGQRGDTDLAGNGRIAFLGAPGRQGAAINVKPTSIHLTEGGGSASYQVTSLARPLAPVTVTVASGSQISVNPTQLVFDPDDWALARTVTVVAVDDQVVEDIQGDRIFHTVTSADALFDRLVVASVAVTITDNDGAGGNLTPTPTPTITPGGPTLTPTSTPTISPGGPTLTPTSTPTITPGGPTLTPTPTPTITPGGPTLTPTPTPTITPGGPTLTPTPTPTITPGGPTLTPTPTPTITPGGPTLTPTPTSWYDGSGTIHLPVVLIRYEDVPSTFFLPLVVQPGLPDLVIEQVLQVGAGVQVILRNVGIVPVTEEFWVEAYIAPHTAPTAVNQTWDTVGPQGLVWGVTAAALPLLPGQTLTLTTGDVYYWPEYSLVALPVARDTAVYVQVDSYGETTYGAVLESHERALLPYNNIYGPAFLAPPRDSEAVAAAPTQPAVNRGQDLPPRPREFLAQPGARRAGQE